MKAVCLQALGGPEVLVYETVPQPQPHAGEVLIRVHATAITPTEFAWEPTWLGGETLTRSWAVLKPGGKLVSVSHRTPRATDPVEQATFLMVHADRTQLIDLAHLLNPGEIRPLVAGVFPLALARLAYEQALQGHLRGLSCKWQSDSNLRQPKLAVIIGEVLLYSRR